VEEWGRVEAVKLILLTVETKSPSWLKEAKEVYAKKLGAFCAFEEIEIRSPHLQREEKDLKIKKEAEKILQKIQPSDFVVVFDEKGKAYRSQAFSKELQKNWERSPQRLVLVIGGAFGLEDSVKARAQWKVSLSEMTMNHWVAQLMALEQLYRALTIQKNIPYHNE
jgi:23S rRNA (pseudouridine1915-N3)-methyltransferase